MLPTLFLVALSLKAEGRSSSTGEPVRSSNEVLLQPRFAQRSSRRVSAARQLSRASAAKLTLLSASAKRRFAHLRHLLNTALSEVPVLFYQR